MIHEVVFAGGMLVIHGASALVGSSNTVAGHTTTGIADSVVCNNHDVGRLGGGQIFNLTGDSTGIAAQKDTIVCESVPLVEDNASSHPIFIVYRTRT